MHDLTLFDTALQELEQRVLQKVSTAEKEIIIIEFARNDYLHALSQFSASFLRDAYILFIDAEIPICKERVLHRAFHQRSSDDHYVSDYMFDTYYALFQTYCTAEDLNKFFDSSKERYVVDTQNIQVVKNDDTVSREQLNEAIRSFTLLAFNKEQMKKEDVSISEISLLNKLQHHAE